MSIDPELPQPEDRRPPWYRRPKWIVPIALAGVLAIAAASVLLVLARRDAARPFREAVAALIASPALHTTTSIGSARFDQRVTAGGDALGRMTFAGLTFDTMTVGGRTYVKPPDQLLSALLPSSPASRLAGRWITGGSSPLAASASAPPGPIRLGAGLQAALAGGSFPGVFDRGSTIDGVDVQRARLSTGDLYVTRDKPYRIVRFAARGGASPAAPATGGSGPAVPTLPSFPALPSLPSFPARPSLPSLPDLPDLPDIGGGLLRAAVTMPLRGPAAPSPAPTAASFDMEPMSPADFEQTFDDLAEAAEDLTEAVDADVKFDVQGSARVSCGGGGCVVTATVRNTVAGTGATTVKDAKVTAQMIATIMVDGRIAGTATSPLTPVPANGTGTLSGTSPEAGAVYQAAVAAARAKRGGGITLITVTGTAEVVATAQVQAQVTQQIKRIQRDRQLTLRGPPGSPLRNPAVGDTDSGPGQWVVTPASRYHAPGSTWGDYQERATGVTRDREYRISGVPYQGRQIEVHFDGYENGLLIDAKDNYSPFFDAKSGNWKFFFTVPSPKTNRKTSGLDDLIDEAQRHLAAAGNVPVEWRVKDCAFAALLDRTLVGEGIPGIRVRCFP